MSEILHILIFEDNHGEFHIEQAWLNHELEQDNVNLAAWEADLRERIGYDARNVGTARLELDLDTLHDAPVKGHDRRFKYPRHTAPGHVSACLIVGERGHTPGKVSVLETWDEHVIAEEGQEAFNNAASYMSADAYGADTKIIEICVPYTLFQQVLRPSVAIHKCQAFDDQRPQLNDDLSAPQVAGASADHSR